MENLLLQIIQCVDYPELRPIFDLTALLYGRCVCLPDTQIVPQSKMAD